MHRFFRPNILFKTFYVDLSVLAVTVICFLGIITMRIFTGFFPFLPMLLGAGLGVSIGILVILWEMFWYKQKKTEGYFHPSYVPHTVNTLFILSLLLIKIEDFQPGILAGFFGYQLALLVGLLVFELLHKKRFTWGELFPN